MTEDRQVDLDALVTPGRHVADDSYGEPKTELLEKAPFERLDFAAPGLPAGWQPLADWCTQPLPAFVGNANAVHFYLHSHPGMVYRGMLFYKPADPPFTYFSRNRFYGIGHLIPNVPWGELYKAQGPGGNLPAPWVRLIIAIRSNGAIAGLTFHGSGGGSIVGAQVGWQEEDVAEPQGGGTHFITHFGRWLLYMDLSTNLLAP